MYLEVHDYLAAGGAFSNEMRQRLVASDNVTMYACCCHESRATKTWTRACDPMGSVREASSFPRVTFTISNTCRPCVGHQSNVSCLSHLPVKLHKK